MTRGTHILIESQWNKERMRGGKRVRKGKESGWTSRAMNQGDFTIPSLIFRLK